MVFIIIEKIKDFSVPSAISSEHANGREKFLRCHSRSDSDRESRFYRVKKAGSPLETCGDDSSKAELAADTI